MMTTKHQTLQEIFLREIENKKINPELVPPQIGNYIYYRNILNPEDNLTIYRYPVSQIADEDRGKVPTKNLNGNEEVVWSLSDLTPMYDRFALQSDTIKKFIEKMVDIAAVQIHDPIYWFKIDKTESVAAIVFDTKRDGKNYEILIKDLKAKMMMPKVIISSNSDVAFDELRGVYYVVRDLNGRACKVLRHQIGSINRPDDLIYDETNPDFEVSVNNTNSFEYVTITIKSLFTPLTTEVWMKHAKDDKGDFSLISPMKYGVHYKIKHSENFIYKMTNEDDFVNYKITKIPIPSKYLQLSENTEFSKYKPKDENVLVAKAPERLKLPGDRSINLPNSLYFENRNESLEKVGTTAIQLFEPSQLIKTNYDAKILDFEVTKNYLCVLEERNFVERLKTMSLRSNKWVSETINEEHYHINLDSNYTYDTQYIRYCLQTPHQPDKTCELNMGTHKHQTINQLHYSSFNPKDYQTERIMVNDCPVILSYNTKTYNEKSPFVLHTLGAESSKKDLNFTHQKVCLMDRGIVYAYPMIKGTKYFDDDWYLSGLNIKRIDHFLEVSKYLKENKITPSLGIYAEGLSGSIVALNSMIREPRLFDAISVHNPITDVIGYMFDMYKSDSTEKSRLINEYGNIEDKSIYETIKFMSPYHIHLEENLRYPTDLLLTYNSTSKLHEIHSQKFIAKMREVNEEKDFMFYQKFSKLENSDELNLINNYSFLALSLLFRVKHDDFVAKKSKDIETLLLMRKEDKSKEAIWDRYN